MLGRSFSLPLREFHGFQALSFFGKRRMKFIYVHLEWWATIHHEG